MFKKLFISFLLSAACYCTSKSQIMEVNYPKIGQPFPVIQFNDVQYYPTKQLDLKSFRGRWVILDFWNWYCATCVAEFPKLDSLQKQFEGKLKIVLVGYTGSQYWQGRKSDNIHIQNLYEKVRKRDLLSLSIAYDSTAFHRLGVYTPLKIIIDPDGIVRGITGRVTVVDMKSFLGGQKPKLSRSWLKDENKVTYDAKLPLLMNGNGGNDTDFLYRSVLSEFKDYMRGNNQWRYAIEGNKLQVIGTDIASLYKFAYAGVGVVAYGDSLYGKLSNNPIVEVKNQEPFKVDPKLRTGMYAYSTVFPPSVANRRNVMQLVQRDLQSYFGYQAKIETRMIPAWRLVTIAKPKSQKSGKEIPIRPFEKGDVPSYPFGSIEQLVRNIAGNHDKQGIFINATRVSDKIDILMHCDMDNFEDVKRALRENGFELVKGEKEMQVVVIKDNPDETN